MKNMNNSKSGLKSWRRAVAAIVLPGCAAGVAWAQAPAGHVPALAVRMETARSGQVLREIVDPATGNRWLLERDADHPGGPGRLVLAGRERMARENEPGQALEAGGPPPLIRAGDRVVLVAHTGVMDAELECVALGPARLGSVFPVRLKIGGRVLEAVALGPGMAEWNLEGGAGR